MYLICNVFCALQSNETQKCSITVLAQKSMLHFVFNATTARKEAIFIEIVKQIVAVFAADIPHEIAARTAKFSRS